MREEVLEFVRCGCLILLKCSIVLSTEEIIPNFDAKQVSKFVRPWLWLVAFAAME